MAATLNTSQELRANIPKKAKPQRQSTYECDAPLPTGMTRAVRGFQTPPPVSPKLEREKVFEGFRTPPPVSPKPEREKAFKGCQIPPPVPPKPEGEKCRSFVTRLATNQTPPNSPITKTKSFPMDAVNTPSKAGKYSASSQQISLKELASRHSKSFPLHIRTLEGFRGQSSQLSISIAEEYNVHFIKHQKVVTIQDSSRQVYSVPLSSAVRFGLIYNPEKPPVISSKPFIFESVSDIVTSKTLPKVVCAMVAHVGDTDRASVSANEVLCITRIHKPKFHGKKSLEVFSLVTNAKKLLALQCRGQFSTDPSLVQARLPSILDHIPNLFPSQAVLFADEDFTRLVPHSSSSLLSSPITLINSKTRTTLVASPIINMEIPIEDGVNLVDIPLDEPLADVKVTIVQPDDASETKRLQNKTQSLFENMDLSKVQSYQDAASDNIYVTQSLLNFSLEKGNERVGIKLDAPSIISGTDPPQVESTVSEEDPMPSDEDELYETVSLPEDRLEGPARKGYEDIQPPNTQENIYGTVDSDDGSDYELFEKGSNSLLTEKVEKLQQQVQNLERSFSSQEEIRARSIKSLEEMVEQLSKQFQSLGTQFTQLSANSVLQDSGAQMPTHDAEGCSSGERNRTALESLSVAQIQQLLDAMQLSQYKEAFRREQVRGDVLIELDEETLQSDLHINSKIHRIRLMKLISGSHSAMNILASQEK